MTNETFDDIIDELDELDEFSHDSDDVVLEVAENERKILSQTKDLSIREFSSMEQDGEIDLQPKYQRKYVATPTNASRLIESVLMDVPIPVIYLAEEKDGTYSVIDGQQRLTSFLSFLKGHFPNGNEFKLTGLKVFKDLNKKTFKELSKEQQTKIKTTTLHTIIIKKESNEDIKFEIFERLNTGSIKLNDDEIRNTVYRGAYIDLLAELENNETFHALIKNEKAKERMLYRGMILRFLALSERHSYYKNNIKQFCNKELFNDRHLGIERQKEYRERFLHCVDLVKTVFGNNAFKRYQLDKKGNGSYGANLNMSLFDVQMCGFVHYSKNEVLRNADNIREAMLNLMTTNTDFIESIEKSTSDTKVLKKRFKIWLDKLDEILGDETYQERIFSYDIKKKLFETNPTCAISGQTILSIDDAEVDHIIPYSKGGKTEIENAQLVLRYFNRQKGNKQ